MGLREEILAKEDLRREPVKIPEWGVTLYVRSMRADERDAYEQQQLEARGEDEKQNIVGIRARLAIACCCDDSGAKVFTGDDFDALCGKSAAALNRIFNVAIRLNGMTKADVDELAKNSEGGPTDASRSA